MISSVIFKAVNTGTPLMSSVERVRANWPNKFSLTARPRIGAFILKRSIRSLPSGEALKRIQMIEATTATPPMTAQDFKSPKKWLMFIRIRVASGNCTCKPSKIVMNFGSMNVMKKMMITTPTVATIAG